MRFRLPCKVKIDQSFKILKASATLNPSVVQSNQVSNLTITSNIENVVTNVASDSSDIKIFKNDNFHYTIQAPHVESEKQIHIFVNVEDIVYKQVRKFDLLLTVKPAGTSYPNNYSASSSNETSQQTLPE